MTRVLPGIAPWRIGLVAVATLMLLFAAQRATTREMVVKIEPGVQPRMEPAAAIALAKDRIASMAQSVGRPTDSTVTFAHAVKGSGVGAIVAESAYPGAAADRTYWVVAAEGTFVGRRGIGGDKVTTSGYFVIDDATGDIVEMGLGLGK